MRNRRCLVFLLVALAACDGASTLAPEARFSTVIVPMAPESFTAQFTVDHNALTWTHTSGDAARFQVLRRDYDDSGDAWTAWTLVASVTGDVRAYDDASIPLATLHRYRIRACNASGCSAWSWSPVMHSSNDNIPDAPQGFSVQLVDSVFEMTWTANAEARRFELQRRERAGTDVPWPAWTPIDGAPASATSYTDTTFTVGAEQIYRIRACNLAGCSDWARNANVVTSVPDASTHTWTKARAGSWQARRNWDPMYVPAATDSVRIEIAGAAPFLSADATISRVDVAASTRLETNGYNLSVTGAVHVRGGTLLVRGGSITIGE